MTAEQLAAQIVKLHGMPKSQDDLIYMLQFAFRRGQIQQVIDAQILLENITARISGGVSQ